MDSHDEDFDFTDDEVAFLQDHFAVHGIAAPTEAQFAEAMRHLKIFMTSHLVEEQR